MEGRGELSLNEMRACQIVHCDMTDEDVRAAVREMIRTQGEKEAVRLLDMPRTTIARLAGDLPVRRGTVLLARLALGLPVPVTRPSS